MRRAVVVGALGLLVGCVKAGPNINQISDVYDQCVMMFSGAPEYSSLTDHGVFTAPNQLTLAQVGDPTFISDQDMQAALDAQRAVQPCRQNTLTELQRLSPALANLFSLEYEVDDNNALALIKRQQTWGQYDENRQHIAYLAAQDAASIENQMQMQQEQEDASSSAHWATFGARLQALGNSMQQRPQNDVSCTSNGMTPGMVTTNCNSY